MIDFDNLDTDDIDLPFMSAPTFDYKLRIKDADTILEKRCKERAKSLYGKLIPEKVMGELSSELEGIKKNGYASYFLVAADLVEYSYKKGYPITNRGAISSSLVAFFMGITEINPIDTHYYCPKCHHFEFYNESSRLCGYDLADKKCPECNETLILDGVRASRILYMGLKFDKEPQFFLNFAPEIISDVVNHIKIKYSKEQVFRAGTCVEREDGTIKKGVHLGTIYIVPGGMDISVVTSLRECDEDDEFQLWITDRDYHELNDIFKGYTILSQRELGMLHDLECETGFKYEDIKLNDSDILNVFTGKSNEFLEKYSKEYLDFLRKIKPRDFFDIARFRGLSAVYSSDLVQNVLRNEEEKISFDDVMTCRDEVFNCLRAKDISEDYCYTISKSVSFGKGLGLDMLDVMKDAGVSERYIELCNKAEYLYPWSQCVEYALTDWRLAYYFLHYPDVYRKIYDKHYVNKNNIKPA